MNIQICGAPCCWGVDDPKNPYLPPWERVLAEAGMAGYSAIELGPYGYLPIDAAIVAKELKKTIWPLSRERFSTTFSANRIKKMSSRLWMKSVH